MTNLEFGLTLTIIGMGGTMVILFMLSMIMDLLRKLSSPRKKTKEKGQ